MAKRCRINKVCRGVKATVGFLESPTIRFVDLETPGAIGCCQACMEAIQESLLIADAQKKAQNDV